MDSKIHLEKYYYWNRIVHANDLMKNKSYAFYESLEKNEEFHESMGLKYLCDFHQGGKIIYLFKLIDKYKYMLAKIEYGF